MSLVRTLAHLAVPVTCLYVLALILMALCLVFLPEQGLALAGMGFAAYVVGLRHALDADHIAAIDTTVRELNARNVPSATVGFWFALGHSSVVIVTVALLVAGFAFLRREMSSEGSDLLHSLGVWGATFSIVFLIVLGVANLRRAVQIFRVTDGAHTHGGPLGLLTALLAPVISRISTAPRMYVVGVLFGLGFDTATTVGLFVLVGATVANLPWYALMLFPVLFTAGMVTLDTANGIAMHHAYRWAEGDAARRRRYNFVITLVSAVAALSIGLLGMVGLGAELLGNPGAPVIAVVDLMLQHLGLFLAGALLLLCLTLVARSRYRPDGWTLCDRKTHGSSGRIALRVSRAASKVRLG